MVPHFTSTEAVSYLETQKNHFCSLVEIPCVFQTQLNVTFQKQLNMQKVIHPFTNQMNLFLNKTHHKKISLSSNPPTILIPRTT